MADVEPGGRVPVWPDMLRRRMLAGADVLAVSLSAVALVALGSPASTAFWTVCMAPVWLGLAKLHGLYDRDHGALRHLTVDELASLLSWATVSTATTVGALAPLLGAQGLTAEALKLWGGVVVLAPLLRGGARMAWRRITPREQCLIVGSGPLERATRRKIELFSDMHLSVAGVAGDPAIDAIEDAASLNRLVRSRCGGALPQRIILASHEINEHLLARLAVFCKTHRVKLSVVPPARGLFGTAVRLSHVADLPLIEYQTWDVSRSNLAIKRAFDVVFASLGLVVLAPAMLIIALAVRIDSRGPVLFRQRRAGLGGRPFSIVKFRTMVADAPARLADVVALDSLTEPMFKLSDDPRVTRVGRVLRRTSLDELPQLFNVLRGDMSLVGPRPEQIDLVERYQHEHRFRLAAKPGMTGPMQIFGRGRLSFEERLAVEREYVENQSLARDVRILLMTLPVVLSRHGAY